MPASASAPIAGRDDGSAAGSIARASGGTRLCSRSRRASPARILAERIGIHQARAAQWVRVPGPSYADYLAIRNNSHPAPDT